MSKGRRYLEKHPYHDRQRMIEYVIDQANRSGAIAPVTARESRERLHVLKDYVEWMVVNGPSKRERERARRVLDAAWPVGIQWRGEEA